jgi:DNA-binding response OmpR family regulator
MNEATLLGRRILVVEDDYWVAQILLQLLEDAGAEVVGPFGYLDEALAFIAAQKGTFDGAILDINLHGAKSYSIADVLAADKVPFIFTTGYGPAGIEAPYADYPRCAKPFNGRALIAALSGL